MTLLAATQPELTWNIGTDLAQLFEFSFMVNAFRAGTIVAVVAGLGGWFMVLRRDTFAGHTLAVIGFPGAAGAALLGWNPAIGYFASCTAGAVVISAIPADNQRDSHERPAIIGTVQAFALACGFLFVSLYRGNLNGLSALLFGSFLGISETQVALLTVAGSVVIVLLAFIARPLLFATIDPNVAASRGVRVRLLAVGFLVLLGLATAHTSQITGSLLVFALLVLPAATAQTITARPLLGIMVSIGLGVAVTWAGLAAAYYSTYPIGFWITSFAFAGYVIARLVREVSRLAIRLGQQRL